MKTSFKKVLIIALGLLVSTLIQFSSFSLAQNRPMVVIFYTDWSARCKAALPQVESIVSKYNDRIDLEALNIDLDMTPDRARSLGISIPTTVPYIMILNRRGNVIYKQNYAPQSAEQINSLLNSLTK